MFPRRGAGGYSDGYNEGSYKRQRVQSEYPPHSPYGGYLQGQRYGSSGRGPGGPFPVVRLRGLPFNCAEIDISDFFVGLDIVDILFVKKQGRFSGDAFVVFGLPLQADLALRKDRQNIGHRYVEVFRAQKLDYYRAVAEEVSSEDHGNRRREQSTGASLKGNNNDNSQHQEDLNNDKDDVEHTGVLKLRGLPFSASKKDIIDFFGDYNVSEESVHIVYRSDGKATGDAFVEFESADDSKAAMSKDRMKIGSRYVELFVSTLDDKALVACKSSD